MTETGDTALNIAAGHGRLAPVKSLIRAGAKVELRTIMGRASGDPVETSALLQACVFGHYDVAIELVLAGADIRQESSKKQNCLSLGAGRGHAMIVSLGLGLRLRALGPGGSDTFIDTPRLPVDAQDIHGDTPIMRAIAGHHLGTVFTLINAGANVFEPNKKGATPLLSAVRESEPGMVALLTSRGAHKIPGALETAIRESQALLTKAEAALKELSLAHATPKAAPPAVTKGPTTSELEAIEQGKISSQKAILFHLKKKVGETEREATCTASPEPNTSSCS